MLRQFSTRRVIAFFLLDLFGTLAVLFVAASLRDRLGALPPGFVDILQSLKIEVTGRWATNSLIQPPVLIVVGILWPFFFVTFSVYDGRHNPGLKAELLNVFLAICVSIAALAGLLYFSYRETPRVLVLIFFVLDCSLLLGSRVLLWIIRGIEGESGSRGRRVALIIGAGPVGRKAAEQLNQFAWANLELIGYLDDDAGKQGMVFEGLPVLGTLGDVKWVVSEYKVQDAIVALPLQAHKRLIAICKILQALSVRVHVIPDLFALSFPDAQLDGYGGIPVIDLGLPGIHGVRRFVKRGFDVIAVTVGLVLLSPLFLLIAVLIKLDTQGPIIYRQQRVGENGIMFSMLKFRSMHVNADPGIHKEHVTRLIKQNLTAEQLNRNGGGSLKLEKDPRITRVGNIIRKTSLDELPQLVNVLRGEMSLVGPRPPLPYEVDLYQGWHRRRFEALPGITGLWQIRGRNRVSFDEMVRMDIEYIEHQSLWLDLNIIFQTPWALISAKGAG